MPDRNVWRRRFIIFTAARLFGLATVLAGVVVSAGDLVRPGGSPILGAIVMLMGLFDFVFAPRLLKKAWDRQDQEDA